MSIVVGCPVKDRGWSIPEWYQAIKNQGIETTVVCIVSASEDNTEALLKERDVIIVHDNRPGRTTAEIDGHVWGAEKTYAYMSELRNDLIEIASGLEADYFLSLDSDIILPSNGLEELLDYSVTYPGVIAPAVNMTVGSTNWNTMDWVDPVRPNLANRIAPLTKAGPADVVMAAMLLDRYGMMCRWQSHSQGEDVGFCLDAEYKHVPRWWLPGIRCDHLMRKY